MGARCGFVSGCGGGACVSDGYGCGRGGWCGGGCGAGTFFGGVVVRVVEEPDPESTPLAGCGAETAVLRPTQFVRNCMRARPMG